MRRRSMVLITSTLCRMKGSSMCRIAQEKTSRLFQAAAGIEQDLFAGDFDVHAEIVVRFQILQQPCRQSDAR